MLFDRERRRRRKKRNRMCNDTPRIHLAFLRSLVLPQWETCQRSSQKCLLDSMQPNNSAAWEGMDCEQGSVSPRYIDVRSAEDVQIAFRFAQQTGVMLSIKASGHDFKGRSGAPGSLGLWARLPLHRWYHFVADI
ncbi:hypothetical protein K435DRAFT_854706 [Dendrothele bispora CBS 962.96]|uniref:FAD linked oxidase N-terminal domain-containing protein n=1 Tax=Dendrothele bispora (strain CBS 962.96) TaxID=1314807 RepID=A0A4S8MD81_DENBC|nr:hypothetical protein K435DRAFT_854706 [Dendrothele bispora CBS 962.96]